MPPVRPSLPPSRLATTAALCALLGGCPGGGRLPHTAATDAGASGDQGAYDAAPVPVMIIHGCTDDSFEDRADPDADRALYFGTTGGFTFVPKCMRVARGQSVTFRGPFASHALTAGVAPNRLSDPPGTPGNPIDQVTTGTEATFTFNAPGYFPYYCRQHWDSSMYGVILVR